MARRTVAAAVQGVVALTVLASGCGGGSSAGATSSRSPGVAATGTRPVPPPSPRDAQGCRYVRTRLPAPPGFPDLKPLAGDGVDRIAGTATNTDETRGGFYPVVWHGGTVTRLATPGGRMGHAIDVNSSGVTLGTVRFRNVINDPGYIWRDGRPIRLGGGGEPVAINDAGLIVGTAEVDGIQRIVYWTVSDPETRHTIGGTTDQLPGVLAANGLDDEGHIVGYGGTGTSTARYAVTGSIDGLRQLPGIPASLGWSEAVDVRAGQVIGNGSYPGHPARNNRVHWRWDGEQYVETPPDVLLVAVNADGVVAGLADSGQVPVAIDATGRVVELPLPPGRWSSYVSDVLDDGSVVGAINELGKSDYDRYRATIWQRRC